MQKRLAIKVCVGNNKLFTEGCLLGRWIESDFTVHKPMVVVGSAVSYTSKGCFGILLNLKIKSRFASI